MKSALNILCVDDHLDSAALFKFAFEAEGHKVITALTAEEAIEHLEQTAFDLYILDIQIPRVGGLELCRIIRERGETTPIVVYSAGAYEKEKEAAYKAGATIYIPKPDGLETIVGIADEMRKSSKHKYSAMVGLDKN